MEKWRVTSDEHAEEKTETGNWKIESGNWKVET
jgi:hypothetical protein